MQRTLRKAKHIITTFVYQCGKPIYFSIVPECLMGMHWLFLSCTQMIRKGLVLKSCSENETFWFCKMATYRLSSLNSGRLILK